jgi:hypothetical protein
MGFEACVEVFGKANIIRTIGAFEDVDVITIHNADRKKTHRPDQGRRP